MKEIVTELPGEKIHIRDVNATRVIAISRDGAYAGLVVIIPGGLYLQWSDSQQTPLFETFIALVKANPSVIFYQL